MSSPKPAVLSFAAEADYRDILAYTDRTWGEKQYDVYASLLDKALDKIRRDPLANREWKATHFRSLPAGKHRICYCIEDDRICVLRILHQRMDAARHLERR